MERVPEGFQATTSRTLAGPQKAERARNEQSPKAKNISIKDNVKDTPVDNVSFMNNIARRVRFFGTAYFSAEKSPRSRTVALRESEKPYTSRSLRERQRNGAVVGAHDVGVDVRRVQMLF